MSARRGAGRYAFTAADPKGFPAGVHTCDNYAWDDEPVVPECTCWYAPTMEWFPEYCEIPAHRTEAAAS